MGHTLEFLATILTRTSSLIRNRGHLEPLKQVPQMNPRKVNR